MQISNFRYANMDFSKYPVFKYDFWEKIRYSNMNFWCLLFTPVPVGHTVGTARVGQLVRVVGGVGGASLGKAAQSEAFAISVIDTMATLNMEPLAQLTRQVVDLRLRGDHLLVL